MDIPSKAYFLDTVTAMSSVSPDAKPIWGIMTPQHMLEHVIGSWRISNGRARVALALSESEVAKRRDFLFSDTPYAQNITNPVTGDGLAKLRKPSFDAAITQLNDEIEAFFEYHSKNPDAIETHPVFGQLDYNGWLIFQKKHMGHHFAQFGI